MAFDAASIRKNVDNIGKCSPDQVLATQSGFHMTKCPRNNWIIKFVCIRVLATVFSEILPTFK